MNRGGPPGGRVPPPNLGYGPPPNLSNRPPPNLSNRPPPNLGNGPPPNLSNRPPPNLSNNPPGSYAPQICGTVVKIFSEADPKFNLGVRGDWVTVVPANDSDPSQQWIKDDSWGSKVKDKGGEPTFTLVNKASGKALAYPKKGGEKVYLTQYYQNALDANVLWSGPVVYKGYSAIRLANDISLNLNIDENGGRLKEGQAVTVYSWKNGANQHWKFETISTSQGRN